MRKSKNITKFDVEWQIIRSSIKGQKTSFDEKIEKALDYLERKKSIDAKERVMNWLEGLRMGYKASKSFEKIKVIDDLLGKIKERKMDLKEDEITSVDWVEELSKFDASSKLKLWKDLYTRNAKWLKNGYLNEELNEFHMILTDDLEKNHVKAFQKIESKNEMLEELRLKSLYMENSHTFFF